MDSTSGRVARSLMDRRADYLTGPASGTFFLIDQQHLLHLPLTSIEN
jgi:hypothetical protein